MWIFHESEIPLHLGALTQPLHLFEYSFLFSLKRNVEKYKTLRMNAKRREYTYAYVINVYTFEIDEYVFNIK